jgi:hypothetical protein
MGRWKGNSYSASFWRLSSIERALFLFPFFFFFTFSNGTVLYWVTEYSWRFYASDCGDGDREMVMSIVSPLIGRVISSAQCTGRDLQLSIIGLTMHHFLLFFMFNHLGVSCRRVA